MNAIVYFLETFGEMCDSFEDCCGCPFAETGVSCHPDELSHNASVVYELVSDWADENK